MRIGTHHGEAAVLDLVLLVLGQDRRVALGQAERVEYAACRASARIFSGVLEKAAIRPILCRRRQRES